jgi:hypothetical protein
MDSCLLGEKKLCDFPYLYDIYLWYAFDFEPGLKVRGYPPSNQDVGH